MKLYIIRGLPGSGKSTFGAKIADTCHAADDFFYKLGNGEYAFDPKRLRDAHDYCQLAVERDMIRGLTVAVANTFSRRWEAEPYYELAEKYGYSVFVVECQNQFGSVHNVPEETILAMARRWEPFVDG